MRDLSVPIQLLRKYATRAGVRTDASVLVIGACNDDFDLLDQAGFTNITLSSLDGAHGLQLDAEKIALPDNSYDMLFAHAMLHHLRCPHQGLREMLRVARRSVVFFEPNDSFIARLAIGLGLKSDYEIAAVLDHDKGGVSDSDIPNFIYRWTANDLRKAARSAGPEYCVETVGVPYWDYNHSAHEKAGTPLKWRLIYGGLQSVRGLLNHTPIVKAQGNHFFGAVTKLGFQPWIRDGRFFRNLPEAATR